MPPNPIRMYPVALPISRAETSRDACPNKKERTFTVRPSINPARHGNLNQDLTLLIYKSFPATFCTAVNVPNAPSCSPCGPRPKVERSRRPGYSAIAKNQPPTTPVLESPCWCCHADSRGSCRSPGQMPQSLHFRNFPPGCRGCKHQNRSSLDKSPRCVHPSSRLKLLDKLSIAAKHRNIPQSLAIDLVMLGRVLLRVSHVDVPPMF